jgi:hypothetical protein
MKHAPFALLGVTRWPAGAYLGLFRRSTDSSGT